MSTIITPGFTGYIRVDGDNNKVLRFNTSSLNATQEVEAPDMVMGDYTHNAWAYGKIEVGGRISGPMTENTMTSVSTLWTGTHSVDVKYYSGVTRQFTGLRANSITINVTAGDVVQFDLELIGTGKGANPAMTTYTDTEKLLTWDKAAFYIGATDMAVNTGYTFTSPASNINNILSGLHSFSMTLTNNITRQFMIRGSDLFGDLVAGMNAITGNLVSYQNVSGSNYGARTFTGAGAYFWDQYQAYNYYPFTFYLGASYVQGTVAFHRSTTELAVGPVLSTIGMTGIGHFSGEGDGTGQHMIVTP